MDLYIDNKLIEDLGQLKDCFRSGDSNIKNELLSYIRNGALAEWLSEGNSPEETQMADAVSGLDYESDDVMLWRNLYEIIVGGECGEKVPSYSDCFELVSISSKDCMILEEKILPNVSPIIYVPKDIEVEMCFMFKVKEPKYASVYLFLVNQRSIRFPYGILKLNKKGVVGLSRKLIFNDDGIWHLIQEENNICDFCVKICSKTLIDEYKLANEGDAVAQYNLGYYFYMGQGVESYTEAVKWYRKSAEQGNASAQYNLGYCYEYGYGVEQSYTEAVKWYRKSADQGDASGQYNLGHCYEYGEGVEKSHDEAVKWWRKSAEQGDASAIERLKEFGLQ